MHLCSDHSNVKTIREKISNTIELFREVTHPTAKGEEAGKIFAKYEQLYSGLAM